MLVILDFLELDMVSYSDCPVDTTAKRETIRLGMQNTTRREEQLV